MSNFKLSIIFFFSTLVGTLLFWVAVYIWFDSSIMSLIDNAKAIFWSKPENTLSFKEASMLGRLVEKRIVLEGSDLLGQISTFYTTIITILITIITVLGISIPLYIKTNAENVAKQQTKNEVRTYFEENVGYHNQLEAALHRAEPEIKKSIMSDIDKRATINEDSISEIQESLEQVGIVIERVKHFDPDELRAITQKIAAMEKYIQQLDPYEKEFSQGTVEEI
ncbi:hypothetical protein AAFX60_009325 [Aliivibrio fischeri]